MRYLGAVATSILLILMVVFLNRSIGSGTSIGTLLSPTHGYLKNNELIASHGSEELILTGLSEPVHIYFDERMVPHIFANNDRDAYMAQGYIHARDRLWQMEFQTHFAAGRLSEIVGKKAIGLDRAHRRLGLAEAAKSTLVEMEKDSFTRMALDAYTSGVNQYISSLSPNNYPLEYKLLGYTPEQWSNYKSALFHKYMSKDLAGYDEDFEKTAILATLGMETYQIMFPIREDSLSPIVPNDELERNFPTKITMPIDTSHAYFHPAKPDIPLVEKPDKDNGSNNWALAGTKTKTGRPILCNDPHLRLALPSIWYECQLTTPEYSAYGASLPGSPGVIIGFNDNVAFGFTNAMRDVMDYYKITFKDQSKNEYLYNGQWHPTTKVIENYMIKDSSMVTDTVVYTHFGPVIYDETFQGLKNNKKRLRYAKQAYAVKWQAATPSNAVKTFLMLNKAKDYGDYRAAILNYSCPGQNMIFASKTGDIAITQQGLFPAKWKYQGDFLMDGTDSTFAWQHILPGDQTISVKNPKIGYVSSGNQLPADPLIYPYYLGGDYVTERGIRINQLLDKTSQADPEMMRQMMFDNYNLRASYLLPKLKPIFDSLSKDNKYNSWINRLYKWDMNNNPDSEGATIFSLFFDSLEVNIWKDELDYCGVAIKPEEFTLVQNLLSNLNFKCVDNINTPEIETIYEQIKMTLDQIIPQLHQLENDKRLRWGLYKNTCIPHLIDVNKNMLGLSRLNLDIGGGSGIINATKKSHGPSWKMIVSLTDEIEAYGVYPGGQSGHPGNPFYDTGVDTWVSGKLFKLWFMKQEDQSDARILTTLTMKP